MKFLSGLFFVFLIGIAEAEIETSYFFYNSMSEAEMDVVFPDSPSRHDLNFTVAAGECEIVRVIGEPRVSVSFKRDEDGFNREHPISLHERKPVVMIHKDGSLSTDEAYTKPTNCVSRTSSLPGEVVENLDEESTLLEKIQEITRYYFYNRSGRNLNVHVREMEEQEPKDFLKVVIPHEGCQEFKLIGEATVFVSMDGVYFETYPLKKALNFIKLIPEGSFLLPTGFRFHEARSVNRPGICL